MRRVARSQQVRAASCSCHSRPARRQLRERFRCRRDGDQRRSGRVRERTRQAIPTRRARTARRASSSSVPGCVATADSRPIRPWTSRNWPGAPCRSRSSSADPRTSPSREPPVAVSPSDDQSNDTQNIPQAACTAAIGRLHRHSEAGTTRPPGSQPTKRNAREFTTWRRNCEVPSGLIVTTQ